MLRIEAARDGFILAVDGRPVLAHAQRRPCVAIGDSELSFREHRGSLSLGRRRVSAQALRGFRILEATADAAVVDFEGRLRMSARIVAGRLRLGFSAPSVPSFFRIKLQAFPEERIYGAGERRRGFNLKGRSLALWVGAADSRPARVPRWLRRKDGEASSFPVPAFVSSRNYWCAVDADAPIWLDFRSKTITAIEAAALPREILMGTAAEATSLIRDLSEALGRQGHLPPWTFDGPELGLSGSIEEAEARLGSFLAAGVRVGSLSVEALGFEAPGRGELRALAERLGRRGIKLIGRAEPLVAIGGELAQEARDRGFCVERGAGGLAQTETSRGPALLIDLTNAAAFSWLKGLLAARLLEPGLAGLTAEGAEHLPPDALLASGEEARIAHNRWPLLWSRACREAIEESGLSGRICLSARSGWLGSSRFIQEARVGSRHVEWLAQEGLSSLVPTALSLGLSGLGFWRADLRWEAGAARSEKSRECLLRWLELAAFCPAFRFELGSVGADQGLPEEGLLAFLARMSEVYGALKPYHLEVAEEFAESGLPALRHPYLHYEAEALLHAHSGQYLYGRDLLVAPVLGPGMELAELFLPQDEWVHLWSSRRFRGGPVTVEAPLGFPAVFFRSASPFASLFDAIRRTLRRI